jgi:hypothetical protein
MTASPVAHAHRNRLGLRSDQMQATRCLPAQGMHISRWVNVLLRFCCLRVPQYFVIEHVSLLVSFDRRAGSPGGLGGYRKGLP